MKFWIEAILEKKDEPKTCVECGNDFHDPSHIFCEFTLEQAWAPSTCDLHPKPTGRFLCPDCSVTTLI